jgi:hypothetical protein
VSNKDRDYAGQNQRWSTTQLLSAFPAPGPAPFPRKQMLVWTPTFDIPRPFWVQILFASATGDQNGTLVPALPFQPFSSARVKITIARFVDAYGLGQAIEDSYIVNGFNPSATEPAWMPVAIVAARKVTITAEIIDETPGHTQQFVDASVSVVDAIDTEQILASRYTPSTDGSATFLPNIFGWGDVPTKVRTPQNAAAVQLLPADQTRRQFWITNEGTARLALSFGKNDPDVTPGAESWDVILDAKGGAVTRYESPTNAHWGEVRGIWEAAGAGFAVASGASIE